jgi:hypothetical protein
LGTIIERSGRFTAQIRIMRKGKTVFTQAQTFERRAAATAWPKKREGELARPGALERTRNADPPLAEVIDRYVAESKKALGKTKAQCLKAIKTYDIASLRCSAIGTRRICTDLPPTRRADLTASHPGLLPFYGSVMV